MYYRRKVLLALIEAFGGTLKRTDCQKLLFLFCRYANQNHYDFFPYKYGSFSFLTYQDKQRLTDLNLLRNSDDFELLKGQSFIPQIKSKDQSVLRAMISTLGNVQGKKLLRKVYIEYPEYACRSTILSDILTPEEIDRIRPEWNSDQTPCMFTIGYEGLTIDAYLNRLIQNNVQALIDVRKNPISMKYGFSKTKLQYYLENAGFKYIHIPELGIPSELRKNMNNPSDYEELFQYYQSEMLPKQLDALDKLKNLYSKYARIALTCYEADYNSCHRHKIAEYLQSDCSFTINVFHL
ncbi:MAG: DUF488 domain-containing protein [Pseudomonadota bacterium]